MFVGGATDTAHEASKSKAVRATADCLPRRETVQDLRANLARIEERSRRLLGPSGNARVVRSVEALAEAGRTEAAAAARTAAQHGEGQSSANVFLAQLGFNVEEQYRLLRRIESTRPVPSATAAAAAHQHPGNDASTASLATAPSGYGNPGATQLSVGAFLAAKRTAAVASLVSDAHAMTLERARDAAAETSAAMWEARKYEIAESTGLRNLLNSTAGHHHHGNHSHDHSGVHHSHGPRGAAVAKQIAARRITKFASVVKSHQAHDWPHQFATVAAEFASSDSTDDDTHQLATLWTSLHRVLSFQRSVGRGGAAAAADNNRRNPEAVLRAVSASRCDLELRCLGDLYSATHDGARPPRADELRRMHVDAVRAMIDRDIGGSGTMASSSSAASLDWQKTFRAMSCGRYDVAAAMCPAALAAGALQAIAALQPSSRHSWSLPADHHSGIKTLFDERASRDMPHRAAVLFFLLGGDAGREDESHDALKRIVGSVVTNLDSLLWFRLVLVRVLRTGDAAPATGRAAPSTQALEDLQRQLLSQQQQLLQTAGGDIGDMADLLIHALLFNTSIRLMSERVATSADAVHFAIALHYYGLLNAPPAAETPLDLGHTLQQYATSLVASGGEGGVSGAASALYRYFEGTDTVSAFVDMCATTRGVAGVLLGRAGKSCGPVLQTNDGALSNELIEAVFDVAEAAASRGAIDTAIDTLVSLNDALSGNRGAIAGTNNQHAASALRAVSRVLELLLPAMGHRILKSLSGVSSDIVHVNNIASSVEAAVKDHASKLSLELVNSFKVMRDFAQIAVYRSENNVMPALEVFFTLPFVPCSADEGEPAARAFEDHWRSDVVAGVLPRITAVVVGMVVECARESESESRVQELRDVADTLVRWFGQVATQAQASEVAGEMQRSLRRLPR